MPVSFGLTLPQRGVLFGATTVPDLLSLARDADESGLFDAVWVGDSLLAKPRPDALVLLGALAAATRRVRLGVGCMASFALRDPLVFAYQWATLDLVSAGRTLLAVCTGIVPGASAREGAQWGVRAGERSERLEEHIEICRRLWAEERVSFAGRFRSFHEVTLQPRPVQQPCPIWIAANPRPTAPAEFVARALGRVARLADGWMSVQLFSGMFAGNLAHVRRLLGETGRDPAALPTMLYHNINIGPDRAAALAESKRFLDAYYGPAFTAEMVEAWTAAGTPEQCVEHLRALVRDGAGSIALRITSWEQRAQHARLVNEVLPALARG